MSRRACAATDVRSHVLDVTLPRKNGFDVCRELRRVDEKTPVIMLTARSVENDRIVGLDAGANGRQLAFLDAEWLTEFWRIDGLSEAYAAAVRGSTASTGVRPRPGRSN